MKKPELKVGQRWKFSGKDYYSHEFSITEICMRLGVIRRKVLQTNCPGIKIGDILDCYELLVSDNYTYLVGQDSPNTDN